MHTKQKVSEKKRSNFYAILTNSFKKEWTTFSNVFKGFLFSKKNKNLEKKLLISTC